MGTITIGSKCSNSNSCCFNASVSLATKWIITLYPFPFLPQNYPLLTLFFFTFLVPKLNFSKRSQSVSNSCPPHLQPVLLPHHLPIHNSLYITFLKNTSLFHKIAKHSFLLFVNVLRETANGSVLVSNLIKPT